MIPALALAAAILFIVLATARLRLHPLLALLLAAGGFGLASGMPGTAVLDAVTTGFGEIVGQIGPVIVAGAIIGAFLEHSGGGRRLAGALIRHAGKRRGPEAMAGIGWLVSIPVFCDTAFIMLAGLARDVAREAGRPARVTTIALALGLYASHVMVPPTPGPVAAAAILGADLGRVILIGLPVSLMALVAGVLFARRFGGRAAPACEALPEPSAAAMETGAPGVARSLLPILAPLLLIVLASIAGLPEAPFGEGAARDLILLCGQPPVALGIGVVLALALPRKLERAMLATSGLVGEAVTRSGSVILVTGAGGGFGKVLQTSGVAEGIGGTIGAFGPEPLLPFLVAAAIKTAQGSSTVAIVTAASLVAPLLGELGLGSESGRALAVVAIGAGAMLASHANDSYFWVVTQYGGIDPATGFRLQTLGTAVQACVAILAVLVLGRIVL